MTTKIEDLMAHKSNLEAVHQDITMQMAHKMNMEGAHKDITAEMDHKRAMEKLHAELMEPTNPSMFQQVKTFIANAANFLVGAVQFDASKMYGLFAAVASFVKGIFVTDHKALHQETLNKAFAEFGEKQVEMADKEVARVNKAAVISELKTMADKEVARVNKAAVISELEQATVKVAPVAMPAKPVVVEPTPVVVEPAPVAVMPTRVVVEPAPVVVMPTPVVVEPTPVAPSNSQAVKVIAGVAALAGLAGLAYSHQDALFALTASTVAESVSTVVANTSSVIANNTPEAVKTVAPVLGAAGNFVSTLFQGVTEQCPADAAEAAKTVCNIFIRDGATSMTCS
ncbi:MAG: hypothetical protein K0U10_00595 [Gammaproteobacteria bacterium]|nr:hypothetical protein [Gammaproteobacteria bacterium]